MNYLYMIYDLSLTNIVGLSASFVGLGIRIPQIYKIYKTKSATDLSYTSVITADLNQILWFSYAYLQNDFSLLLSATGHFIICSTLLVTKIYYDRKKTSNEVAV